MKKASPEKVEEDQVFNSDAGLVGGRRGDSWKSDQQVRKDLRNIPVGLLLCAVTFSWAALQLPLAQVASVKTHFYFSAKAMN